MTDPGVAEDEFGGSSCGAGGLGSLIHLCRGHCTVVEQDQGLGQLLWVAGVGWLQEGRPEHAQIVAGWSGVMSLPRVLTMSPSGGLGVRPAAEVESLRRDRVTVPAMPLGDLVVLDGVSGDQLDIEATFEVGAAARVELHVRRSPGGEERTVIAYEAATGELSVEREHSSLDPDVDVTVRSGHLGLAAGERLRLRVIIDHSVLEVFANDRFALTNRIYPVRPDALQIAMAASGARARLTVLDAWRMTSIWPAPMTS